MWIVERDREVPMNQGPHGPPSQQGYGPPAQGYPPQQGYPQGPPPKKDRASAPRATCASEGTPSFSQFSQLWELHVQAS